MFDQKDLSRVQEIVVLYGADYAAKLLCTAINQVKNHIEGTSPDLLTAMAMQQLSDNVYSAALKYRFTVREV